MKISIIIPVYNEAAYLDKCLQSIAAQTVLPHEVIVVDNNSSDGSAEIAAKYDNVEVLHETQQGPGFARARGFAAASGEVLARIDADTRLDPEWVKQVQTIFEDDSVVATSFPTWFYDVRLANLMHQLAKVYFFFWNWLICGVRVLFGSNMAVRANEYRQIEAQLTNRDDVWEDLEIALLLRGKKIVTETMTAHTSMRSAFTRARYMVHYMMRWVRTYRVHSYWRGVVGSSLGLIMIVVWWPLVYLITRGKPVTD